MKRSELSTNIIGALDEEMQQVYSTELKTALAFCTRIQNRIRKGDPDPRLASINQIWSNSHDDSKSIKKKEENALGETGFRKSLRYTQAGEATFSDAMHYDRALEMLVECELGFSLSPEYISFRQKKDPTWQPPLVTIQKVVVKRQLPRPRQEINELVGRLTQEIHALFYGEEEGITGKVEEKLKELRVGAGQVGIHRETIRKISEEVRRWKRSLRNR